MYLIISLGVASMLLLLTGYYGLSVTMLLLMACFILKRYWDNKESEADAKSRARVAKQLGKKIR